MVVFCILGAISHGVGGVVTSPKIVINLPRAYKKLFLKENHNNSAVRDKQTSFYFIKRIIFIPDNEAANHFWKSIRKSLKF